MKQPVIDPAGSGWAGEDRGAILRVVLNVCGLWLCPLPHSAYTVFTVESWDRHSVCGLFWWDEINHMLPHVGQNIDYTSFEMISYWRRSIRGRTWTLMWRSRSDAENHVEPSRLLCLSAVVRLQSQGSEPLTHMTRSPRLFTLPSCRSSTRLDLLSAVTFLCCCWGKGQNQDLFFPSSVF